MTQPNPSTQRIAEVAASLTPIELELFMGKADDWGSWMFPIGNDLCARGLGRKHYGSIYFDTPLARAVRNHLEGQEDE